MRRTLQVLASALLIASHQPAQAASASYVQDAKSCNSNDKTTLKQLCPNGMGVPTYPSTQEMMNRNPNIANMIVDSANKYGVDPKIALAVSAHEGAMSACAGSFSGVQGPMQLTQATGRSYGKDRGILTENIDGGMLTLKSAINRCGGTDNVRCLANIYNGSTESQRRNWTNDVQRRFDQLKNSSSGITIPSGCNGANQACFKGDLLPPTNPTVAGTPSTPTSTPLATSAPTPKPTDIVVGSGLAMLDSSNENGG